MIFAIGLIILAGFYGGIRSKNASLQSFSQNQTQPRENQIKNLGPMDIAEIIGAVLLVKQKPNFDKSLFWLVLLIIGAVWGVFS